jgi:hypothetical protein
MGLRIVDCGIRIEKATSPLLQSAIINPGLPQAVLTCFAPKLRDVKALGVKIADNVVG